MAKSASSQQWLQRQSKDAYVKQAQQDGYRSRAVYKLQEIDQKLGLFKPGQTVVDLGAAPGSWSQYVRDKVGPQGRVIAVDILAMEPIEGVHIIQGDFTEDATIEACLEGLENHSVDLVISDMAPNISGIKVSDQARSVYLAELAADFAYRVLKPGGSLLVKIFQGAGVDDYQCQLREHFRKVTAKKPKASRDKSREFYVLASSYDI